jgi:hypothetical protein
LGDGPPGFPQGFSCPAVLRVPLRVRRTFAYMAITFFGRSFQTVQLAHGLVTLLTRPYNPRPCTRYTETLQSLCTPCSAGFGLFRFRSPLLSESLLFSLPPGTEMVHFPGFASTAYVFSGRFLAFSQEGFPIRTSPDQYLLAVPRGFSQLATSFIACLRQGIHRTPLVA